jgi:hypothetical protein
LLQKGVAIDLMLVGGYLISRQPHAAAATALRRDVDPQGLSVSGERKRLAARPGGGIPYCVNKNTAKPHAQRMPAMVQKMFVHAASSP